MSWLLRWSGECGNIAYLGAGHLMPPFKFFALLQRRNQVRGSNKLTKENLEHLQSELGPSNTDENKPNMRGKGKVINILNITRSD